MFSRYVERKQVRVRRYEPTKSQNVTELVGKLKRMVFNLQQKMIKRPTIFDSNIKLVGLSLYILVKMYELSIRD